MGLPTTYLVTTKNLEPLLNSLITARAPDAFTQKFLQDLEFKSTNDRLYIGVLKSLGFLDDSGVPTELYFSFLDQAQSKRVLASAIKEAYSDLFGVKVDANTLTEEEVKNKFRTLTQGKYSDKVVGWMAKTFRALVDYADWSELKKPVKPAVNTEKQEKVAGDHASTPDYETKPKDQAVKSALSELHYNIQIHLPESRDPGVYDAIFKSLRNHLTE